MAVAPLRYCGRCGAKTSGRCACRRQASIGGWRNQRGTHGDRLVGRALQRARRDLFDREPLCRLCVARGLYVLAVIRDHIVPLAEGGQDDEANIQPLCQACSDAKTQAEARRGRQ